MWDVEAKNYRGSTTKKKTARKGYRKGKKKQEKIKRKGKSVNP